MIIGTAGHIDHGKTTLVRALTGVDTDRLPEEKRRGISIELGYAYLHAPDGVSLGFVDVPGHERLLHTMLAGATGIDHALLVVAADDGVMPQTREHLAVVALLGVREATVAITKIDRIDEAVREARLAEVHADIAALLAPTPLAQAPMLAVSATTGEGIDALRERLLDVARQEHAREDDLAFRLAVDRAFTLSGVGTVVTGTVFSGTVRIGDELHVVPGDRTVRVRGIHAQNQKAESAHAGQRCALALAGVTKDEMHRGDWVCAPAIALATDRIDVLLTLWPDEAKPLRSGATVHAHLGASDVMASVALLDRDALAPGETAFAQLVLREAIGAWHGDRGVLRDASATRTVAGVRVLDPFAPVRYRRTPERLRTLAAWAIDDRDARVAALLHNAPLGVNTARMARALSLADEDAMPLPGDAVRIDHTAIAQTHLDVLEEQIAGRLADFHRAAPDEVGPDARRLKRLAGPRTDDSLWRHALDALVARGALVRSGTWLHLPDHAARLGEAEQKLAQKLLPRLAEGGFDPPWVRDLAKDCSVSEPMVRQTLASLARRGEVFQVVKDLYYPLAAIERLAALARDCLDGPEGLQAASFRDATGLGRKRAIQLLEFFDRVGYTRRVKDTHLLRPDTSLFGARP
ncbi:selenocysteine-specific translation elongation factor [Variovorax paradoxus]|uniref:selenocysteine-specific translation elongation factor n=1 Tax=Variovorax paradoxus TaxID=34073 RepID=UPI00215F788B|nr:selenocysteine-specific translation elongation factor [Variovorax paradoxus]UVH58860.1 selenocysteine-specific translation elongation factor [Variovorax paradoxus]